MVTISKSMHKGLLAMLFFDGSGGSTRERRFPMNVISAAARSLRALRAGTTEGQNGEIRFVDGDVTLSDDEAAFLKDLLASLTEATPTEYEVITEIRSIFDAAGADQPTGDNVVSIA